MHSRTVEIAGLGPVLLERSKKARRVIISVSPLTGVRVAVPHGSSFRKAEQFAHTQIAWIERQLARVRDHQDRNRTVSAALDGIDKAEARRRLTERLEYLAARHGFTYGKVSLRNQRTRWGSCSSTNNISLNMGVVGLPQELMDYVILHELAHTRIKNHSVHFWGLMDTLVGNGKALAVSLREYRIGCL